jgi:hypothetical protein
MHNRLSSDTDVVKQGRLGPFYKGYFFVTINVSLPSELAFQERRGAEGSFKTGIEYVRKDATGTLNVGFERFLSLPLGSLGINLYD